jgi:hypothetical protein
MQSIWDAKSIFIIENGCAASAVSDLRPRS